MKAVRPASSSVAMTPPKVINQASKGRRMAKVVAGAGIGVGLVSAYKNRSGPAADRQSGRPTGPYMF